MNILFIPYKMLMWITENDLRNSHFNLYYCLYSFDFNFSFPLIMNIFPV